MKKLKSIINDNYGCEPKEMTLSNRYEEYTKRFNLIQAVGGIILEVENYNSIKDRWNRVLYMIDANQNVGESVARIVNLELLR